MRSASTVAVMAAMLLVSSIFSQERAAPASNGSTAESVKKLKELRVERIVTLEKRVDQLATLFQHTRAQYDDVLEAQQLLIEAKLEAAEADEERIGLHDRLVAVLKALETNAQARRRRARTPAECTQSKGEAAGSRDSFGAGKDEARKTGRVAELGNNPIATSSRGSTTPGMEGLARRGFVTRDGGWGDSIKRSLRPRLISAWS